MNKQVWRLTWQRHKWLVIIAAILMILYAGRAVQRLQTDYHTDVKYTMTPAKFHKDLQRPKDKRWTDKTTYTAYLHESLDQFSSATDTDSNMMANYISNSPQGISYLFMGAIFVLGLLASGWDHYNRFDRFIFASGIKRSRYYWTRTNLYLALVVVGSTLSFLAIRFASTLIIPAKYNVMTGQQLFGATLLNVVFATSAFALGYLFALLCGRLWLLPVLSIASFYCMDIMFENVTLMLGKPSTAIFDPTIPGKYYWFVLTAFVVAAIFCLLVGAWGYRHVSAETLSLALVVSKLQPLAILIGMVVGFFVLPRYTTSSNRYLSWFQPAPLIVLALGLIWHFWPQILRTVRQLVQKRQQLKTL